MATSGTVTFSVTELDVITDAMENISVLGAGDTLAPEDITTARRKLNLIIKQWVSQIDFAPGLKMWTRRRAYLFPQKDQTSYSLGPSGDHATESYVRTTLSVAAAASAGSVTLTTVSGLSSGMYIGILLDTGALHWTTINGAPAGQVVTLTAVMPSAAALGNTVFAYTTKMRRPFELETCVRRDTSGNDFPVNVGLSLNDYEAIPEKAQVSSIDSLYFEAQRTNAVVYTNCAPDDVTDILRFVYLSYIEDLTGQTQDVDFPAEWFRALSAQLSLDLCPAYEKTPPAGLVELRNDALLMARRAYQETSELSYQNCPDDY